MDAEPVASRSRPVPATGSRRRALVLGDSLAAIGLPDRVAGMPFLHVLAEVEPKPRMAGRPPSRNGAPAPGAGCRVPNLPAASARDDTRQHLPWPAWGIVPMQIGRRPAMV